MFDPSHNAVKDFYLVNGDLAGSWEGLPQDMIIVNWNSGKPAQSLPFFAQRGHVQVLAGYYDGPPDRIRDWLAAGRNLKRHPRRDVHDVAGRLFAAGGVCRTCVGWPHRVGPLMAGVADAAASLPLDLRERLGRSPSDEGVAIFQEGLQQCGRSRRSRAHFPAWPLLPRRGP